MRRVSGSVVYTTKVDLELNNSVDCCANRLSKLGPLFVTIPIWCKKPGLELVEKRKLEASFTEGSCVAAAKVPSGVRAGVLVKVASMCLEVMAVGVAVTVLVLHRRFAVEQDNRTWGLFLLSRLRSRRSGRPSLEASPKIEHPATSE